MSVATQITRLQGVRDQIRTKMVSLGLSENTDLLQNLADDLDGIEYRGDASATLSTSTRSKTLDAGYYTGGTITVPNDYFPVNSTNTTATAGTVLKDYKFVNSSGTTVTGTIATADSSNVSGSVSGDNPEKITLTADKTSKSSSTTATARAIVTKGLYTGSSNIEKDLTSKTFTATAEATLANTNGAIELTAGTSAFTKTSTADYSNGFITSVKVNPTPSQSKTASPSTSEQTISPDNGKLLSSVVISAIPTETKTITAGTSASTTSATSGKFITSVTVNPTPSQSKSVTPTMAEQTVSPDAGKLLSSVTVNAVPSFSVAFTSASWSSDGNLTLGQYYATVNSDYITASNNLYVIPRSESDTTTAQSFGIYAYSQSNGSMQFRAVAKPTSTVTYTVYYLN